MKFNEMRVAQFCKFQKSLVIIKKFTK